MIDWNRTMRAGFAALVLLLPCLLPLPAHAEGEDAAPKGIWQRDTLTGDWGGARTWLADHGISLNATYMGEAFGNLSGGVTRTSIYEGRLELATDLDLTKLFGWGGAKLHANAYQIQGHGLSSRALDNLFTVSGIEARPTTRLFTLWLEQSLLDDQASIRIGQLAADDEFIISDTASLFANATFGWPAFAATALPSGGPAYPLAAPGVRLRYDATDSLSFLGAIFSGDPAGAPGTGDPQLRNSSGTNFSFRGGSFLIAEAQYGLNQGDNAPGLPGTYKLGFWYHTGSFADQRFDARGIPLASPASSGVPRQHDGNYAIYGVADQTVWRGDEQALTLFMRLAGLPSDRNAIDFYVDAGLGFRGLIAGRSEDKLGLAFAYGAIADAAIAFDRDVLAVTRSGVVRDHEALLELTYQAQITPWWSLQPDLQFVFHPGGNIANPRVAAPTPIRDAVVVGVRSVLKL